MRGGDRASFRFFVAGFFSVELQADGFVAFLFRDLFVMLRQAALFDFGGARRAGLNQANSRADHSTDELRDGRRL